MRHLACLTVAAATLLTPFTLAQSESTYQLPPPEVVEILDAAPAPSVSFSPDGEWMLLVERPAMPSIAEVARPMERLAGMRIDPVARNRYATGYASGLVLRKVGAPADGSRDVRVPLGGGLGQVMWAPDSRNFAFTTIEGAEHRLIWTHVEDVTQQDEVTAQLNTLFIQPEWLFGGRAILFAETPGGLIEAPELETTPTGPTVQETTGGKTPTRTYQDLLENENDVRAFEHYATVSVQFYEFEGGTEAGAHYIADSETWSAAYGDPFEAGLWTGVSLSPDGQWFLRTRLAQPYSYLLPWYAFPTVTDVVRNPYHASVPEGADFDGPAFQPIIIENKPLDQNIPIGGVRLGRRSLQWSLDAPATLLWVTALDGGDPKAEVPARDAWFAQDAPFTTPARELFRTQHRARGLRFTEAVGLVVASDYDRDRRWTRSWLVDLNAPGGAREGLFLENRASRDAYGDPGDPLTAFDADGARRIRVDNWHDPASGATARYIYRAGNGASPGGLFPFLDRMNLDTGKSERLWQCAPETFETVAKLLDARGTSSASELAFVTRFESTTVPPNYRRRTLAGDPVALTAFPDPTPAMRKVHKELVTYERADGVPLSATLYLPANYEPGQRLPLLVWAYPLEYNDASTAGQVTASDARFTRVSGLSHLVLLTQGYAILDGATMPIVGDAETMNDRFIEQIVMSAQAAIDFAVERGIAERSKAVVGGHSYGAFMTANLLAHSDLFATGIARSGAYNRSLTPFGFQSERRTFWEAPDAYFAVSPFMHAHKINEPLLMIHGEIDNNSGTFPIQSERLFQAIKGNGGTARLVMLPAESHGYRARESVMHVQAETIAWLKRFVQ